MTFLAWTQSETDNCFFLRVVGLHLVDLEFTAYFHLDLVLDFDELVGVF